MLALAVCGCPRRIHPWELQDAGPLEAPAPSIAAPRQVPFASSAAPVLTTKDAGHSPEDPDVPVTPVRIGGPWVRCYGGFRPSGEPVKDVTRLGLLCGPENGMRRLSARLIEGSVIADGPGVSEAFEARRGECYRVFAVAEPSVTDLDVTVRSSRRAAVAADHGEDSWPIVQPDRPFCPLEDDRYVVEVTARHGSGRFAAEIWFLGAPAKPPNTLSLPPTGAPRPPLTEAPP